ncbi:hypothetical protein [Sphingobium cupriresistens]|uniref:Uncharacterized protein n=1 Tax=Sphingobium cupriresistens TaxID=1132417 RepID=A0A8G2DY59_9SPHN|nr:hypothetical protein [Sphingobium cupriresistens]RYM07980.1 hypothetical protein EWH12_17755 [Sphingobium cupriresistens]
MPPLPRANAAFFSGALEYVIDLDRLLDAVSNVYHVVVCSYAGTNNAPDRVPARRRGGWVNDLKISEVIALFETRDYLPLEMKLFGPHSLFVFRRKTIPIMSKIGASGSVSENGLK